jgi:asparaginyl-tRNA synthetase
MQIVALLKLEPNNQAVVLKGWVRTKRGRSAEDIVFIAMNDGSTINNIQAVVEPNTIDDETLKLVTTGSALEIHGILMASQGAGQNSEIKVTALKVYGTADPDKYPLQPKKHSLEFLREIAHLRPRTNTFSAILRIRHALAFAIHQYFHNNGFFNLHTPIITASDAEGAGEMFHVTTFDLNKIPKKANWVRWHCLKSILSGRLLGLKTLIQLAIWQSFG